MTSIPDGFKRGAIRTWMAMTVEDQRVAHDGLQETYGQCLGLLYSDDGMVVSQDAYWMKRSTNILVILFQHYGLATYPEHYGQRCLRKPRL